MHEGSDVSVPKVAPREPLIVEPAFVVLITVQMRDSLTGVRASGGGVAPLPAESSRAYIDRVEDIEARLLGKSFLETRRVVRRPIGRVSLAELPPEAPAYADTYLVTHQSGAALWEIWLPAPEQTFDAARWIDWLDPASPRSLAASVWRILGPLNRELTGAVAWTGMSFPVTVLRTSRASLTTIVERHGEDLVRLLYLDPASKAFKRSLVREELARDYCLREGGLMLLGRRGGLDVHGHDEEDDETARADRPPDSALPFVITLELLLLERAVLETLYGRLASGTPSSIDDLLALKRDAAEGLEEYSGAITEANRFGDAVTADGERLLGLADLYDAVMDRLEMVRPRPRITFTM